MGKSEMGNDIFKEGNQFLFGKDFWNKSIMTFEQTNAIHKMFR